MSVLDIHLDGHVCVDLTPTMSGPPDTTPGVLTEVGPMAIQIGGAVGNGARTALRMGRVAAVTATVGADELGGLCRAILSADHPATVWLSETTTHSTSYSVVLQPPGTDRSFWHHTGANDEFDGTCELAAAPIVHFGYPSLVPGMTADSGQPTAKLFARARAQGSATSLDLAHCAQNSPLRHYDWDTYFAHVLQETDVFCPSWDDITSARNEPSRNHPGVLDRVAVEQAAATFLGMGAAIVLITVGEQGSYLATGNPPRMQRLARTTRINADQHTNISAWIAAAPIERFVTSNGAGDTFKVAFLLSLLRLHDPRAAAREATLVVARHIGGLPLVQEPV